jgi:hypothetical protein
VKTKKAEKQRLALENTKLILTAKIKQSEAEI